MKKKCPECRKTKNREEYYADKNRNDGLSRICKECRRRHQREYHHANRPECLRRMKEQREERRKPLREFVIRYLEAHPCADCGEADIVVLEFDHLNPALKLAPIATLVCQAQVSIADLKAEMEKCDVVCANCHRERTAVRADYYRADHQIEQLMS